MRPHRTIPTPFALSASFAVVLALCSATGARAQGCGPASCGTMFRYVDFETLPTGASVEGPGAIHPDLIVTSVAWPFSPTCPPGSARVIEEGNTFPYGAYGTIGSGVNGCLNGLRGFADDEQCVLDYDFTFAPGVTVSCFSIRILDYGDYFPFGGSTHQVLLTAYDAGSTMVSQDQLLMGGGVDLAGGDACVSQAGSPGNFRLVVSGSGIVKVTLTYDAYPDPNVGYDDITFCESTLPTPALPRTWGALKTLYR